MRTPLLLGRAYQGLALLLLGVLTTCLAVPAALAQAETTATAVAKGGVRTTLFPVTMDAVTGQRFVVTFAVTPSVTGTLRAVGTGVGRVAVFRVDAPTGGAVTLAAIAIATAPPAGTALPAKLPARATVGVVKASGATITCPATIHPTGPLTFPAQAPGTVGTVAIPAACRVPGTTITCMPYLGAIGQGRPPATPIALPSTGLGGTARRQGQVGGPLAGALALGLLLPGVIGRPSHHTARRPVRAVARRVLSRRPDGSRAALPVADGRMS